MAAHRLEIRDDDGTRSDYTGAVGNVQFSHGLSVDLWDVNHWHVRRLLSAKDGGGNLHPRLRIMRDPEPAAVPTPVPAPPPSPVPAPAPAEAPADARKEWGAKMTEARKTKKAAKQAASQ